MPGHLTVTNTQRNARSLLCDTRAMTLEARQIYDEAPPAITGGRHPWRRELMPRENLKRKNNQLIRADDCKYCVAHPHISFCGRIDAHSDRDTSPTPWCTSWWCQWPWWKQVWKAQTIQLLRLQRTSESHGWRFGVPKQVCCFRCFLHLSTSFNPATSWSQPLLQWGQASSNGPWRLPFKFLKKIASHRVCVHCIVYNSWYLDTIFTFLHDIDRIASSIRIWGQDHQTQGEHGAVAMGGLVLQMSHTNKHKWCTWLASFTLAGTKTSASKETRYCPSPFNSSEHPLKHLRE